MKQADIEAEKAKLSKKVVRYQTKLVQIEAKIHDLEAKFAGASTKKRTSIEATLEKVRALKEDVEVEIDKLNDDIEILEFELIDDSDDE
mmetsp:Transcript_44135/g.32122  ORF Transcript_44135/g.32122 Transcript_44135/m.32122 type:complete len:89 (+) Transcript_44135:22-288(+)